MLILGLLFLASCSEKKATEIVGLWVVTEDPENKIEFFSDGTLVASRDGVDVKATGKYNFLEDGRLKVEMSLKGLTDVNVVTVTFEGDTLTTVERGKTPVHFTRVTND